jgi:ATP/maltotriose-dependent transcriptional regulator MalT
MAKVDFEKIGAKRRLIRNRMNYGNILNQEGKVDSALIIFKSLIPQYKELNDYSSLILTYDNLGLILMENGDFEEAKYYFEEAIRTAKTHNNRLYLVRATLDISECFLLMGRPEASISKLLEIDTDVHLEKSPRLLKMYFEFLYNGYKEIFKYQEALSAFELYKKYSDTLGQNINNRQVKEIETKLKLNQEREERLLAQNELQSKEIENSKYKTTLVAGLSIALILFLSAYIFIQKLRTKNAGILAERNALNSRINQFKKGLVDKLNLINQLQSELQSSQIGQNLSENLLKKITEDKDWLGFMADYEKINPTFFSELRKRSPNLTAHEMRISTLIKLNMSTKEIASILAISPDSARKAKHRLKKKLNIEESEKLDAFLCNTGLSG